MATKGTRRWSGLTQRMVTFHSHQSPMLLTHPLYPLERPLVADRGATWWQDSYGVSPTPTQVPTQLAHRRLRNREIAPFTLLECPLVADTGATWWQGSYCLSPPPTKVSTQLAHVQLRNSTFLPSRSAPWWPIWVPPGGKVAMACTHHPPEFQPNWPTED